MILTLLILIILFSNIQMLRGLKLNEVQREEGGIVFSIISGIRNSKISFVF